MLQTFRAWLRGNRLEWVDEVPDVGDRLLQVHVTVLDEGAIVEPRERGQQMAEILEKLANSTSVMDDLDPIRWQQETRQDRSLPGR